MPVRASREAARVRSLAAGAVVASFGAVAHAQPSSPNVSDADELALAAETARAAGLFDVCVEKDTAAAALEPKSTTRVHLAGCAERIGKVLLALRHMQAVLD